MTTVVIAALGVLRASVNAALLIAQLRLYRATDGSYAAFRPEGGMGRQLTGMRLLAFLVTDSSSCAGCGRAGERRGAGAPRTPDETRLDHRRVAGAGRLLLPAQADHQ